ncbi:MAG: aspartate--ammonia ligase [Candidatus Hodarchaeales archaeon]|jgi:aspartate--ammonia ligase
MSRASQEVIVEGKNNLIIPNQYKSFLDIKETEIAIKKIKDFFQINLAKDLNLTRVSAPRFVKSGTGINDDLSGVEMPVSFNIENIKGIKAEIVHSLAKWKRMALADYGFNHGEGLYTDMDAIRAQEELDNLHSIYVDQWDWEKIISKEERNLEFLKTIVRYIYIIIKENERFIHEEYPQISPILPKEITFIHSEDLVKEYPKLSMVERENAICKKKGAVFIIGIGGKLIDGKPHDLRAPDYDDWSTQTTGSYKGLNGDILLWYPVLNSAFEISSMGIRVDSEALERQLMITGNTARKKLMWHKRLLSKTLPLSIGGGIGQSRLCMFFLRKAHIGEVQCSVWPNDMVSLCRENNIFLL